MAEPNPTLPPLDAQDVRRFHELVDQRGPDDCWPWKAAKLTGGYGQWRLGKRTIRAHRVAYFIHYHENPGHSLVLHSCDNPPCCNPRHLSLGTWQTNAADCAAKGRLTKFIGDRHWSRRRPDRVAKGERVGGCKLTIRQVGEIRSRYLAGGVTQQTLADEYGVKRETIGVLCRGDNWGHLPVNRAEMLAAGKRNRTASQRRRNAKLTVDQVRAIRETWAGGQFTQPQLARRYGVSHHSISAIVRRKVWADVA